LVIKGPGNSNIFLVLALAFREEQVGFDRFVEKGYHYELNSFSISLHLSLVSTPALHRS